MGITKNFFDWIDDLEIQAEKPLTESLMTRLGRNCNYLKEELETKVLNGTFGYQSCGWDGDGTEIRYDRSETFEHGLGYIPRCIIVYRRHHDSCWYFIGDSKVRLSNISNNSLTVENHYDTEYITIRVVAF